MRNVVIMNLLGIASQITQFTNPDLCVPSVGYNAITLMILFMVIEQCSMKTET